VQRQTLPQRFNGFDRQCLDGPFGTVHRRRDISDGQVDVVAEDERGSLPPRESRDCPSDVHGGRAIEARISLSVLILSEAALRPGLGHNSAEVGVCEVDCYPMRPGSRGSKAANFSPIATGSGKRILCELFRQDTIAAVQADCPNQPRMLLYAEGRELRLPLH